MAGKITFQFDDGFLSHYETVFPLFKELDVCGCLSLMADPECGMGYERALEMQAAGWEILSHSITHPRMDTPMDRKSAYLEIVESKTRLEVVGFSVRQFVTPYSELHPSLIPLVASVYDAAFTVYTDSRLRPAEALKVERPCNRFALHRACLGGKSLSELCAYVDLAAEQDAWLVFYDHDIGSGQNSTTETLRALLTYLRRRGVCVLTSSEALEAESCRTRLLREGWNGTDCLVHARIASDGGDRLLITAQNLNTAGDDYFDTLQVSESRDGGKSWTSFRENPSFEPRFENGTRTVCCDMTPLYHRKTGLFLALGHSATYATDALVPMKSYTRVTPYAVFDDSTGTFGPVRRLQMPEAYIDSGSGCCQCLELADGDILIPFYFAPYTDGIRQNTQVAVMRCGFDGESLTLRKIGNALAVPDEVRGIGEPSVTVCGGTYYLTIRGDRHGYCSKSSDGLHYTQPAIWRWEDGEIVPTYNTQAHFFTLGDRLFLVYTRRDGKNNHVFRNRAPLYATEVNQETLRLVREREFVAVPERGARLGNFGICQHNRDTALLTVTEWMQPKDCEAYGSDNALWLTDFHG